MKRLLKDPISFLCLIVGALCLAAVLMRQLGGSSDAATPQAAPQASSQQIPNPQLGAAQNTLPTQPQTVLQQTATQSVPQVAAAQVQSIQSNASLQAVAAAQNYMARTMGGPMSGPMMGPMSGAPSFSPYQIQHHNRTAKENLNGFDDALNEFTDTKKLIPIEPGRWRISLRQDPDVDTSLLELAIANAHNGDVLEVEGGVYSLSTVTSLSNLNIRIVGVRDAGQPKVTIRSEHAAVMEILFDIENSHISFENIQLQFHTQNNNPAIAIRSRNSTLKLNNAEISASGNQKTALQSHSSFVEVKNSIIQDFQTGFSINSPKALTVDTTQITTFLHGIDLSVPQTTFESPPPVFKIQNTRIRSALPLSISANSILTSFILNKAQIIGLTSSPGVLVQGPVRLTIEESEIQAESQPLTVRGGRDSRAEIQLLKSKFLVKAQDPQDPSFRLEATNLRATDSEFHCPDSVNNYVKAQHSNLDIAGLRFNCARRKGQLIDAQFSNITGGP
jgi:hypothetical protein